MLKVGQKVFYSLHDLGFGKVFTVEDGFQSIKKSIYFGHRAMGGFLNDSKCLKALRVDLLARDVELLIGFFASGVRLEVHRGVLRELRVES